MPGICQDSSIRTALTLGTTLIRPSTVLKQMAGHMRRSGSTRSLRPAGAPASDLAGWGLDRSPGPSLRLRSRGARLLPAVTRETPRAATGAEHGVTRTRSRGVGHLLSGRPARIVSSMLEGLLPLERPLVIFDTETTGTNPRADRIVEIACVKIHPDGRRETWQARLNPGIPIPPLSTAIHRISDRDVAGCPR